MMGSGRILAICERLGKAMVEERKREEAGDDRWGPM
jgi:hypothetical protein